MKKLLVILLLCSPVFGQFQQKPMLGEQVNRAHLLGDFVGCWLMNEDSGNQVYDLSGNGNTGTFQGTAPSWTSGKFGSAVLLPGTDEYIDCGNRTKVASANGTIVMWIKLDSLPIANTAIVSAYEGGNTELNRLRIEIDSGGGFDTQLAAPPDNIFMVNDGQVVAGVWTQVVFTWNTTHGYIYQDAVFKASDTKDAGGSFYYPFHIGANIDSGSPASYLNGMIGLCLLYQRYSTPSEIALLYPEPFCMFERDDVALMEAAIPAPTVGGQVIIISKAAIPLLLIIPVLIFMKKGNSK